MILHKMLMRQIIPVFLVALLFFVMILQLLDLFSNLWRYLQNDVPLWEIAKLAILYFPKCVSLSLPVGLLFAISFTLGNLYANNELISVFGSGISLYYFTYPLLILGFVVSFAGLWFEDQIVIETYKTKVQTSKELLRQQSNYSNSNVVKLGQQGKIVYYANYYNDKTETLSGVIYIERNDSGEIIRRIDADWASFKDDRWVFNKVRIYTWSDDGDFFKEDYRDTFSEEGIGESPSVFRKVDTKIDEMTLSEAKDYIDFLKRGNLPVREAQTDYHNRFAFSFTPLIVALLSSAIGGRFKKNILLMSLLISLIIGVGYYVIQMVTVILAKLGYLPPIIGAWFGVILTLVFGLTLFLRAKT